MRWNSKGIPVAIAEAKKQNKIFVVFISGDDDQSKQMSASLEDPTIIRKLDAESVALQLKADSDTAKQFSQIYPVVIVPSTFFIGTNGTPLEVIGGNLEADQLREKIDNVLALHDQQKAPQARNLPSASGFSAAGPSSSIVESQREGSPADEAVPLENRIERAAILVESIRAKKAQEEEEQEKLRELERRQMGKDLLKLKQRQQEEEAKKVADEIAKERMEEKAAREKVREQINRDRLDRAAKYNEDVAKREKVKQEQLQAKLQADQEKSAVEAANRSQFARLQFRLPDGSSSNNQFAASATLQDVYNHVKENIKPPFSTFTMSVAFPKREFVQSDYSQTLRDLQLAPSASIYILPPQRSTALQSSSSSGSLNFVWLLLAPFVSLWRVVSVFLFGNGGTPPPGGAINASASGTGNTPLTRPSMSRRGPNNQPNTFQRQEGNIYRLHDPGRDGDDDESNTWNGNSTQQM